jgi:hypothetical protein
VSHVCLDQVASSEGGAQAELSGQDGSGDDAGQLAGVLTGGGGVGSANTEQIQHSGLCLKDGTATDGADLNGRHRDGNLKVAIVAVAKSLVSGA